MESQIQSVFTDIGKINFRDPANYYLIPNVPGLASNSVASAAWLSSEGEALFALPSAAGGIFVIKLPPHDMPGKDGGTLRGLPSSSSFSLTFLTCVFSARTCMCVQHLLCTVPVSSKYFVGQPPVCLFLNLAFYFCKERFRWWN